jgi:hypothetical protein
MPGWIRSVGAELWALFVDDRGLALSAAVWVALIAAGLHFGLSAEVAGPAVPRTGRSPACQCRTAGETATLSAEASDAWRARPL